MSWGNRFITLVQLEQWMEDLQTEFNSLPNADRIKYSKKFRSIERVKLRLLSLK